MALLPFSRKILLTTNRSPNNATQPPLDWPVDDPYHEAGSEYQLSLHVTSYTVDPTYNKESVLETLATALRGFGLTIAQGIQGIDLENIGYETNKTEVWLGEGPYSVSGTVWLLNRDAINIIYALYDHMRQWEYNAIKFEVNKVGKGRYANPVAMGGIRPWVFGSTGVNGTVGGAAAI